ncbi:MAG: LPS assembly lipoprotein LptE [Pseudomonadota bacterium]
MARQQLAFLALLALAAVGLAGCGFTPLYATPGVSSGLSSIEVVVPEGRVAFLLREDLDDALARDKAAAPAWRLDLAVAQTRDPRGLRADDVAERYELGVNVKYTLTEIASGRIAHIGQVASQVSYDAADAPYAGIAARQDSQQRAAADAARKIHLDLAAWMASRRTALEPAPAG